MTAAASNADIGTLDSDQTALLAAIVESSRDAIISKDLDEKITSWNRGAQLIFGYSAEEMIGRSIRLLVPAERQSEEDAILAKIRAGERIEHHETIRQRKDGELIHVSMTISPIRASGGKIIGASNIGRDITERHRAAETQRLLMREVNHRSKNLLAVVEAMVRKTASTTPAHELVSRISQRLQALSSIQNLLIYGEWRGVDLRALVDAQLRHYPEDRVSVRGPAVMLQPPAAQALGLAIHELATNAARYGALSTSAGHVTVGWNVDDANGQPSFEMEWREHGGPLVDEPKSTSFGTTILRRATSDALSGTVQAEYRRDGLRWHLSAPMTTVSV